MVKRTSRITFVRRAYIDHSALEAVAGCEAVCAEDAHRGQEESQDFSRPNSTTVCHSVLSEMGILSLLDNRARIICSKLSELLSAK